MSGGGKGGVFLYLFTCGVDDLGGQNATTNGPRPLSSCPSHEAPWSPHLCKSGCLGRPPLVEWRSRWPSVAPKLEQKETVVTTMDHLIQLETPCYATVSEGTAGSHKEALPVRCRTSSSTCRSTQAVGLLRNPDQRRALYAHLCVLGRLSQTSSHGTTC